MERRSLSPPEPSVRSIALVLGLLTVLTATQRCDGFKVGVYLPAAQGGVSPDALRHPPAGLYPTQQHKDPTTTALRAASAPTKPPINLYALLLQGTAVACERDGSKRADVLFRLCLPSLCALSARVAHVSKQTGKADTREETQGSETTKGDRDGRQKYVRQKRSHKEETPHTCESSIHLLPSVLFCFSFSRLSPLKVRLEHRELASSYSAYESPAGSDPGIALGSDPGPSAGSVGSPGGGIDVHHLVFSYDPSVVSAETQQPFRYLEGQSVSFVNLTDTRQQQKETPVSVAKPRLYSVASSPLAPEQGLKHSFSLCVKRHRYRGADGEEDPSKDGLCSSLLCSAPIGTEFEVAGPVGASLLLPEDPNVPIIFACTGTGVAPLRSFMRRIVAQGRSGPVIAYVGAATAASTPYKREWTALQQQLPPSLLQLHFALSREANAPDGGRLYVQHLMERDGDLLLRLLREGAPLYLCGRKDMVPPIKGAIQAACLRHQVDFASFFKSLISSKRWKVEVY
ncbi:ferredoxin NADP+ oxidoreductase, putative [Eimeria mitis]|uniref:ferredoxin--NADP(+) reductase n=1 Tax=Eimeria mitis TaxID=44415 RepID=U6KI71_9EIME|nr:ferredoxin NADP+ oxidoreductase, putative [Eimeria mitis]CDJ35937.1 ferredoxin NADP+ oxidoreductase, putative [Eimeria mitis]